MFEYLKQFRNILVTGPQRSGTRICARMIAGDTGFRYVDEKAIGIDSLYRVFSLLRQERRCVVQCPALCRYAHILGCRGVTVILMRRAVNDIITSQRRIGWTWEKTELARYDLKEGIIAEVKYRFWEKRQLPVIPHALEVEYESLAAHPMWVPRESRRGFAANQTEISRSLRIPSDARPAPVPGVEYFEGPDGRSAVVAGTRGQYRRLNATGRVIWSLLDGTRTCGAILESLAARFHGTATETLSRDMEAFLSDLVASGFVIPFRE